jgi:hypothetical protein
MKPARRPLIRQAGLVADQNDPAVKAFLAQRRGALEASVAGADDQNLLHEERLCMIARRCLAMAAAPRDALS